MKDKERIFVVLAESSLRRDLTKALENFGKVIYVINSHEYSDEVLPRLDSSMFKEYACSDAPSRTYRYGDLTPDFQRSVRSIDNSLNRTKKPKDSRKYQRH